jgi:hypothetical protein
MAAFECGLARRLHCQNRAGNGGGGHWGEEEETHRLNNLEAGKIFTW